MVVEFKELKNGGFSVYDDVDILFLWIKKPIKKVRLGDLVYIKKEKLWKFKFNRVSIELVSIDENVIKALDDKIKVLKNWTK